MGLLVLGGCLLCIAVLAALGLAMLITIRSLNQRVAALEGVCNSLAHHVHVLAAQNVRMKTRRAADDRFNGKEWGQFSAT